MTLLSEISSAKLQRRTTALAAETLFPYLDYLQKEEPGCLPATPWFPAVRVSFHYILEPSVHVGFKTRGFFANGGIHIRIPYGAESIDKKVNKLLLEGLTILCAKYSAAAETTPKQSGANLFSRYKMILRA